MAVRYAVYFAPNPLDTGSTSAELHKVMVSLLGRDALTGEAVPLCVPQGFTEEEWRGVVKTPAHYGLHATLKAPFELVRAGIRATLMRYVAEIASHFVPFSLPKMQLAWIPDHSAVKSVGNREIVDGEIERGFFALVPEKPSSLLPFLERACVMDLDTFRAPLSSEDIARRHLNTERERNYLAMWGYHRVLEDFCFHITLTGSIANMALRDRVQDVLEKALVNVIERPLTFDSIVLFRQQRRTLPFVAVQRFQFSTIQQEKEHAQ